MSACLELSNLDFELAVSVLCLFIVFSFLELVVTFFVAEVLEFF